MKPDAKLLRMWLHEPLVHFLAAGLVLFALGRIHREQPDPHRIVITAQREARLANQYELQFGMRPDPGTLQRLVDGDIHEEILFREGRLLGLDQNDEIVRRRIVQKMRFLLEDLQPPAQPDGAQLDLYYRAHSQRYRLPARVTFSHIYFSPITGESAGRERAKAALRTLSTGAERAPQLGDPFPDLYDFSGYEREQVARVFGNTELSEAVFSIAPGHWAGPYKSAYGWHLLFVQSRDAEKLPPLAAIRARVQSDYLEDQQQRTDNVEFSRLAGKFTVVHDAQERQR